MKTVATVLMAIWAAPAAAQDQAGSSAVEASQIVDEHRAPGRDVGQSDVAPLRPRPGPVAPPSQLADHDDAVEASPQLARETQSGQPLPQLSRGGDTRPTTQLYRGGPTAQPAEPLSEPAEGRTAAVAAVGGRDRCDPQRPASERVAACERVIETRSAEFVPVETNRLSPEQRLLVEQRNRIGVGERAAAQRLATAMGDPDELRDQEIASVVLGSTSEPPPAAPAQAEEELPAASQALIEAIVGRLSPQR